MKHFYPLFVAACLVNIFAAHAAEPSGKTPSASAAAPQSTVYFNDFENRVFPGMKLWCGFHIAAQEGVNESSALRIRLRKELDKNSFCVLELPELPAGKRFWVSFDICGKNLKFEGGDDLDKKFECVHIEQFDLLTEKSKRPSTIENVLCHPTEEYQKKVFSFLSHKDCRPRLIFKMPAKWSGILLIDNVRVADQAPEQ